MSVMKESKPLIYSCSGCSSAAQAANYLAVRIDRTEAAEMSCIAGVGGDVAPLVRTANSGRSIVVLDGCALSCAKNCLKRHNIKPNLHINLGEYGIKKKFHQDPDPEQMNSLFQELLAKINNLYKPDH